MAYFSWIIFFNSISKWLKPRLIENNLILAKNPKNQCLKFSDFSTKSGSLLKGLVILKLNVPNFGPFYYLRYFNQKLLNSFLREIEASYHQLDCQCQSMPWRLEVMRFFIQFPFFGKPLLLSKAIMIELLKTRKLLVIDQTSFYRTSKRLEHNFSKPYLYVMYI